MLDPEIAQFLAGVATHVGAAAAKVVGAAVASGASLVVVREGVRNIWRAVRAERAAGESSGQHYAETGETWDEWEEKERHRRVYAYGNQAKVRQ